MRTNVKTRSKVRGAKTDQIKRLMNNHVDREQEIVNVAIAFFADVGFDGSLRDLARRIGITHQNLFRYFSTKEDLIERVCKDVFLEQWRTEWDILLANQAVPFQERLVMFYQAYLTATYRYTWIRIFVYASLKDAGITRRYMALIKNKVIEPIGYELRRVADLPIEPDRPLTPHELEVAWSLHGELFYVAVRRWVHNMAPPMELKSTVERAVARFLAGTAA